MRRRIPGNDLLAEALQRLLDEFQPPCNRWMDTSHAVIVHNGKGERRGTGLGLLDQRTRLLDDILPPWKLQCQWIMKPWLLAQNRFEQK